MLQDFLVPDSAQMSYEQSNQNFKKTWLYVWNLDPRRWSLLHSVKKHMSQYMSHFWNLRSLYWKIDLSLSFGEFAE